MSEKLTVTGLTPLELRELENALGPSSVEEIGHTPPDATFPEPTSLIVATVVLSSLALNTLSIIATRPRQSRRRELRIERTEGKKKFTITLKEDASSSDSPRADVVEKIGKALAIDLKSLGKAITAGK